MHASRLFDEIFHQCSSLAKVDRRDLWWDFDVTIRLGRYKKLASIAALSGGHPRAPLETVHPFDEACSTTISGALGEPNSACGLHADLFFLYVIHVKAYM